MLEARKSEVRPLASDLRLLVFLSGPYITEQVNHTQHQKNRHKSAQRRSEVKTKSDADKKPGKKIIIESHGFILPPSFPMRQAEHFRIC